MSSAISFVIEINQLKLYLHKYYAINRAIYSIKTGNFHNAQQCSRALRTKECQYEVIMKIANHYHIHIFALFFCLGVINNKCIDFTSF